MKINGLNKKGFTFVEILAVVAIMGILSGIAIISVSRYRDKQVKLNYDALAKSVSVGYDNYTMKNGKPYFKSIEELEDKDFISNRIDPLNSNKNCDGYVYTENNNNVVELCCGNYKTKYIYRTNGSVDKEEIEDYCSHPDIEDPSEIEPIIPTNPVTDPEDPTPKQYVVKIHYRTKAGDLPSGFSKSSSGTIYKNGDLLETKIKYGESLPDSGLPNYHNSNYLYVNYSNHNALAGSEWVNIANGKKYDQNKVYNSDDFCDAKNNDCSVVLDVNWLYKVTFEVNTKYQKTEDDWETNTQKTVKEYTFNQRASLITPSIYSGVKDHAKYYHEFGWRNGSDTISAPFNVTKDITLKYYYKPNTITVYFKPGNATGICIYHKKAKRSEKLIALTNYSYDPSNLNFSNSSATFNYISGNRTYGNKKDYRHYNIFNADMLYYADNKYVYDWECSGGNISGKQTFSENAGDCDNRVWFEKNEAEINCTAKIHSSPNDRSGTKTIKGLCEGEQYANAPVEGYSELEFDKKIKRK